MVDQSRISIKTTYTERITEKKTCLILPLVARQKKSYSCLVIIDERHSCTYLSH